MDDAKEGLCRKEGICTIQVINPFKLAMQSLSIFLVCINRQSFT